MFLAASRVLQRNQIRAGFPSRVYLSAPPIRELFLPATATVIRPQQQEQRHAESLPLRFFSRNISGGTTKSDHKGGLPVSSSIRDSWIRTIQQFLDEKTFPVGSLTDGPWRQAQEAILQSDRSDAGFFERSMALLDRFHREVLACDESNRKISLPLDEGILNVVIEAWRTDKKAAKLIPPRSLLQKIWEYTTAGLVVPNAVTYNKFLHALKDTAESAEATVIATTTLEEMMRLSGGNCCSDVHPDVVTINTVIDLWSKSGLSEAPDVVEKLLQRLYYWYEETKMDKFKPDAYTYSSVIATWARSEQYKEAGKRAKELLDDMKRKGLMPNSVVYVSILQAMTRQVGFEDAAFALLNEMKHAYNCGNVDMKPTVRCFNTVISAFARRGDTATAERLLTDLEDLYQQTHDPDFRPDSYS